MKLNRPKFYNFEPGDFPSPGDFDVVETKKDGWWGQVLLEGDSWQIWSRAGRLVHSGTIPDNIQFPGRTLVHGEYLFGTEWAKDRPDLYDRVALFSAQEIFGESMEGVPLTEVREHLDIVSKLLNKLPVRSGTFVVEQYPISEASRIWEEFVLGEESYEGLVFKNSKAPWNAPMGRMKRNVTMDYVCLDVKVSDSDSYAGTGKSLVGGLYIDGVLTKVAHGIGGLTNELRDEFFKNRDNYIGKVFEAEGKKISKRGKLRHPNFLRWREDKLPEECIWPQK